MDNKSLGLVIKNDYVTVSSLYIAKTFNKKHSEVIYAIEGRNDSNGKIKNNGLIKEIDGISQSSKYFIKSSYIDSVNRKQDEYLLTRDGFVLLVMGFNGKEALSWKIKYINEFNRMESVLREKQSQEWLQTRRNGKIIRRDETDKLNLLLEYAIKNGSKTYLDKPNSLFALYTKLVNKTVGIVTGEREICVVRVLSMITMLEDMIQHTVVEEINKGTDYHEIYYICKVRCSEIMRYAYLPEIKLLK